MVHMGSVTGGRGAVVACHATLKILWGDIVHEGHTSQIEQELDLFIKSNRLAELIKQLNLPKRVPDIPVDDEPLGVFGHELGGFDPKLDRMVRNVSAQTLGEYVDALKKEKLKENPDLNTQLLLTKDYWSKIKKGKNKNSSKHGLLRIAVALRLNLKETEELFMKAGFSLIIDGSPLEAVVGYFISQQKYDVFEINAQLMRYNQPVLIPSVS